MKSLSREAREAMRRGTTGLTGLPARAEAAEEMKARSFAIPGTHVNWIVACTILFLHVLASVFLSAHVSVTCVGLGGCYGVAAVAAFQRRRGTNRVMRTRWLLVAAGLLLGFLGLALTLYRECLPGAPAPDAGVDDVALLLRGFPFLMALCLSRREVGTVLNALSAAQMVLLSFLASFAVLFAAPTYLPVSNDAALVWITAANVAVALLANVRCFGTTEGEDQGFFRVVTAFLWSNALITGALNWCLLQRLQVPPGSPFLVFADLPVLGLLVAMGRKVARGSRRQDDGAPTLAETVSSLSIPICTLLLAALIVPGHLYLGLSGVAMAFLLYGVRSTIVLRKELAAQQELLLTNRSMADQAFSDALTGIPNRRSFDLSLEREWKRAQRSRQPLALLMIDVDHFKKLNDQYGHPGGDTCLRQIAALLRSGLRREADIAARYGGEEFAILLIDTGIEGARKVGESLRRTIEQHHCAMEGGVPVSLTISVGIASEVPMVQESSLTLVAAADKALYRAKRSGRNRVEVHAWQTDAMPEVRGQAAGESGLLLDADA